MLDDLEFHLDFIEFPIGLTGLVGRECNLFGQLLNVAAFRQFVILEPDVEPSGARSNLDSYMNIVRFVFLFQITANLQDFFEALLSCDNAALDVTPEIEDMKIVVFLSYQETFSEIITATSALASTRPVGLSEVNSSKNVSLYPNPASDYINIQISNNQEENLVELVNLSGQTVYSRIHNSEKIQLYVKDFEPGLYLIRITNREEIVTEKLIIE